MKKNNINPSPPPMTPATTFFEQDVNAFKPPSPVGMVVGCATRTWKLAETATFVCLTSAMNVEVGPWTDGVA